MPAGATYAEQRVRLMAAALRALEDAGPEALQARRLAAEIGASTQAIYTLFGGMPRLFEAIVAEGFQQLARHVETTPASDDAVADFFAQGWSYCEWGFAHPQLYRLMFGLTGGGLRSHTGFEMTLSGTFATFPGGLAAIDVMVRSLARVVASGRIRQIDPVVAAGQFLSATHGYLLLEIAGAFGQERDGLQVIRAVAVNLMVGLGDERAAAERSLGAAIAVRDDERAGTIAGSKPQA
jgi:AcrR family transcriptional regulator